MIYLPDENRYGDMKFRRCGRSGLKLPLLSLGLWHNFGGVDSLENSREMVRYAFDHGITHFDLANNYGPPHGSAEETFGRLLKSDLKPYRDELVISSKAGWYMWPGPYGDYGSRKYLIASLDQSLKRLGLDYVDIYYHHRPDPDTPLEETMGALDHIVKSGRALYVGISSYSADETRKAAAILKEMGTPCLVHQPPYNMFNRDIERGVLNVLDQEGIGCIVFSPLAQGLLTTKYLKGIPKDSRAAKSTGFLQEDEVTEEILQKVKDLKALADKREQTLPQLALSWILRRKEVTSVIIGASRVNQIKENLGALKNLAWSSEDRETVDDILAR